MSILEVEDLREYLRIPADDTDDDGLLATAIAAATSAIRRSCNRTFDVAEAQEPRIFRAKWDAEKFRVVIDIDDTFNDAEDISLVWASLGDGDFDTPITTTFRMWPFNAASKGLPFTKIILDRGTSCPLVDIEVSAEWGWDATPETIRNAGLIQASRYVKRRDAPFGIAGSPDMGNELRLLAKLDPDVAVMVGDYRRWWGAA